MFVLRDTWRVSGFCGSLPLLPGPTDKPQKGKGSLETPWEVPRLLLHLPHPTPREGLGQSVLEA